MAGLGWLFGGLKGYGYTDTEGKDIPQLIKILNDYRKKDGKEPVSEDAVGYRQNAKYEVIGENKTEPENITNLLGQEYKGYKGQDAINKLLKEKTGHIKGAFHREDIGDIDLLWGNDDIGLQHIIKQRVEQGIDIDAFLSTIADTVGNGELRKVLRFDKKTGTPYTNYEIIKNRQVAVVQPEFKGNKFSFVITAYKTRKASW